MKIYNPLEKSFKINEDAGFIQDQILQRVQSEENFVWALGFPLIKSEDITHAKRKIQ